MTENLLTIARSVAETGFGLEPVLTIEPVGGGLVNATFRVTTPQGEYALQRLHPVFGSDGAASENTFSVCQALTIRGFSAPRVVLDRDGRPWVESDGIWRAVTWMPGRPAKVKDSAHVTRAAAFLGLWHKAINDPPPELKPLPPADYNRERVVSASDWENLDAEFRSRREFNLVAGDLARGRDLSLTLGGLTLSTRAVVHGDPKLDNFLFDDQGRVTGLIDLDTVRIGYLLWELGDALRSWAHPGNGVLDEAIFRAAASAYAETGLTMLDDEWAMLPKAVQNVALNLALRYFKDYFERTYFAWDRTRYASPAVQNRARGLEMLSLAERLLKFEVALQAVFSFPIKPALSIMLSPGSNAAEKRDSGQRGTL